MIDIDDIFQGICKCRHKILYVLTKKKRWLDCWIAEKEQKYFIIKGLQDLNFHSIKAKQTEYEHIRFTAKEIRLIQMQEI